MSRRTLYASADANVDPVARTISGLVLPWNVVGNTSMGPTRFARGSVRIPNPMHRVKLLKEHDRHAVAGYAAGFLDTPAALLATYYVAPTRLGADLLDEADALLRDGLSVGVDLLRAEWDRDGVLQVSAALLRETSIVAVPAWDDSRLMPTS